MFSFSNIFKKAALFGASTVAGVAVTGTIMANPVQAATMYRTEFNITSNLAESELGDGEVLTGDFSFTKTKLDSGEFSYKLTDFNVSTGSVLNIFEINESFTLNDVKANPLPFLALNETFIQPEYQTILPSVLRGDESNYVGNGDFPGPDSTLTFGFDFGETFGSYFGDPDFSAEDFDFVFNEDDLFNTAASLSEMVKRDPDEVAFITALVFSEGGQLSFTTKAVPEPATILGLGVVGVGLTATRRKRKSKKIKQKIAA